MLLSLPALRTIITEAKGPELGLTRQFRENVRAWAQSDKKAGRWLLSEAVGAFLRGDCANGRAVLRCSINAGMGFPALAAKTGIHVKTLHQMFGPRGNPTTDNLFKVIACLQAHEGVRMRVVA